jgi:hypothetical protein
VFKLKNSSLASVALLAAALAVPAAAQDEKKVEQTAQPAAPQQPTAPAKVAVEEEDDKMVCRSIRVTGSRVREKVCRTKGQWAAIERAARESGQIIQGAGAVNTTPTPGG